MSQHDYNLADATGGTFRADLNQALAAIVSQNSGATEPATMFAYQFWADTTSGKLKQRNAANNAWIEILDLAAGEGVALKTHAATSKTTPVDADEIPLADSAASFGLKKLTWANLKSTVKTYFDTLYLALVAPGASGNILTSNGSAWTSSSPPAAAASSPIRQTVLGGPVDTNGLPTFMPSTSSTTTVTSQNVSTSYPLVVNAAGGATTTGVGDRIGSSTANLTWTGLTVTNAVVNYGYVDVAANGTLTTGVTTQAPIYQQGGTPATTSGLTTFNIGQMQGFTGNGSSAPQSYRVFLWEGTGNGTNVAGIVAYAYNGYYDSGWTNTLPGGGVQTSKTHGIGLKDYVLAAVDFKCLTAEGGFAVGDIVNSPSAQSTGYFSISVAMGSATSCSFTIGSGGANLFNKTSGATVTLTAANWAYRVWAKRRF